MNLVAANLLASLILVPLLFAHLLTQKSSRILCIILRGLFKLTSSASIFGQLLIGIDQYLAVINPLHYHRNINESRCKIMSFSIWIISGLLVIICNLDHTYQFVVDVLYIIFAFILPIVAIFAIYCQIFIAARSNSIKTRRNSSCSMTQEPNATNQIYTAGKYLQVETNNNNLSRSPSSVSSNIFNLTSSLRASMRSKLSNASLFYGEESRAAKITILVVLSIFFCWLPTAFVTLYTQFYEKLPLWTYDLALICSLCNSIFSPVLYAFRSKRVQRDVKKVFLKTKSQRNRIGDPNKVRRLKSLSCPQLLISSVNENEKTLTISHTEKEPMMMSGKKSLMIPIS